MSAVQDTVTEEPQEGTFLVENYHLHPENVVLAIVEAASNLDTWFDAVIVKGEGGSEHFEVFSWKKISKAAGGAMGVVGAALTMLEDLHQYQCPVAMSAKHDPTNVYVRRIPATGPLTTTLTCTPMFGRDVAACCACVAHGDMRSIHGITRFDHKAIRQWSKSGVKAKREDVRRVLLGILDDYTKSGQSLSGRALGRDEEVTEFAEIAVVRRAWIGEHYVDLLAKVQAIQTLRNPVVERKIMPVEPEQPLLDFVEEGLKAHKEGRLCAWCERVPAEKKGGVCDECETRRCEHCKKADAKGRRLCSPCEDTLISQSGVVQLTESDLPKFDDTGLVGAVLPKVGKAAFDAGIVKKEDYDYIAEQVSNIITTFDENEIELEDAGIFIRGVNYEDGPVRARHRSGVSADGVVIAAGMKFRPHILRHLMRQIDQTTREIIGMYGEPLLEAALDPDDKGVVIDFDRRKMLKMLKSRLGLLCSYAEELGAELEEDDFDSRVSGF